MPKSILDEVSEQSAGRITCGPPREGATEPCLSFISNVHRLMHYVGTPIVLASKLDETVSALMGLLPNPPEVIQYRKVVAEDLKLSGDLLLTRSVDYFLTYISGLLGLVFQRYPAALGGIPIKLSDVLQSSDRESIIRAAVDEYVRGLSYHGLRQLQDDIKNKVGFKLFEDSPDAQYAVDITEVRNILVHNNGYIDSRLARNNSKYQGMEGDLITGYNPLHMSNFLTLAVQAIDIAAVNKWNLPAGQRTVPHLCHRLGHVPHSYAKHPSSSDA